MSKTKNTPSLFDEDFEVTYEEEVPFTYTVDSQTIQRPPLDETIVMDASLNKTIVMDAPYSIEEGSDVRPSHSNRTYDEGEEDDYDDYVREPKVRRRDVVRPRPRSLFRQKRAPRYGTKNIYHTAKIVVRIVSLMITAGTFGLLAYTFWHGAAPYGDPRTILTEKNVKLLAYTAIASLILLFEFFSFLWSTTKVRIKDGRTVYREDIGRGLGSFIVIYVGSYASFLFCSFLPDSFDSFEALNGIKEVLNGIKGAMDVFGSLHNVLFGVCLAGVISCLVRRHMI